MDAPQHIYGVVDSNGTHTDVSTSERGAKQYATRHGYTKVSVRFSMGYNAAVVAEKKLNGRWKTIKP